MRSVFRAVPDICDGAYCEKKAPSLMSALNTTSNILSITENRDPETKFTSATKNYIKKNTKT